MDLQEYFKAKKAKDEAEALDKEASKELDKPVRNYFSSLAFQ